MTRGIRRVLWLPSIAAAGVLTMVMVGAFTGTSAENTAAMTHITAAQLQDGGLSIAAADRNVPVTREQAIASALSQFPNMPVREARLARVHDVDTPLDRACWIVDMTPPGGLDQDWGPAGANPSPPHHAAYLVVVVDGQTGQVLFGRASS
jgi:D-alanyl-D-alanine carboxypeptidase